MGGAVAHRFGHSANPFNPAAFGGSIGDGPIGVCIALRPAAGQTIQYVGGIMGGQAGTTSDLGAFNYNGVLAGGISASTAENDIVIAPYAVGSTADRDLSMTTSGYTEICDLYQDTIARDTNLSIFRKFMSSSPDAGFTLGPTGNAADAGAFGAYVFRGVDLTVPMDVAFVEAEHVFKTDVAGTPDAPSFLPATYGAVIIVIGAASAASFAADFTGSDLTAFLARREADTNDVSLGIGHKIWLG